MLSAFSDAPNNSIILIEDIDTAGVVQNRQTNQKSDDLALTHEDGIFGITLSGLLNSLDGVCSPEGRIVIMTTNYKDKLDPALIRSGRIDIKMEIGLPSLEEKLEMFQKFYPGEDGEKFLENSEEMSMADIQELLIRDSQETNVREIHPAHKPLRNPNSSKKLEKRAPGRLGARL